MSHRSILAGVFCLSVLAVGLNPTLRAADSPPNIVILFTDDMGYGDLGCYGHPLIQTPHIDQLAAEGMRFTSFVTGSWCVPSRTQLMTGRYLPRVRYGGSTGANGNGGMPDEELTLAESLHDVGYRTHMVGKWHLGHADPAFLPVNHGFDTWLGLPYSNDYRPPWVQTDVPLGLYRDTEMIEHPLNQDTLTTRYTAEAVKHIRAGGEQPFFLYLAYNMPHLPLHTAERFRGKSQMGLYGDVIETLDWSVGEVLQALEETGVAENTVVFFASDNGPWLDLPSRMRQAGNERWHAGSPGLLRGSKGTTYEGGPRVPAMIRWPGKIAASQATAELVGMPDIYRTMIAIGGGALPDLPLDGHDLVPFLRGEVEHSPREDYFYFRGNLQAVRVGDWKLRTMEESPELFNLRLDPSERFNRAADKPELVETLRQRMEAMGQEVNAQVAGS